MMKKIPSCQNHLKDLYEALKSSNVKEVEKIEHQLSPSEECVACSYIFKARGEAKEAFAKFLNEKGFVGFAGGNSLNSTINFKAVLFVIAGSLVIGFINYLIIGSWFGKNGPANIGSIEVSYVSMGKFLTESGLSTFAPYWYLGFPFHVFYTPLLPFLEFLLHKVIHMPLWESYRYLTGVAYILGPISVFLLSFRLTKKVTAGLLAGVIYSIAPTIFYFLVPGVAADKISASFWDPRRFTILVRWGEGPHLFSLIFMPLVGVFFFNVLKNRKLKDVLLTALFLGLTALSNAIGFFAAIILIGIMTFVHSAQRKVGKLESFKWPILTGFLTLGLISFWYNLSFIGTFFREGGGTGSLIISLFPWGWIAILGIILLIYYLLHKYFTNFSLATSLLLFLIFFIVVHVYYTSAADGGVGIEILPQALRYNVEVDLSLALLVSVLFSFMVDEIRKRVSKSLKKIVDFGGFVITTVIILGLLSYIQPALPTYAVASSNVAPLDSRSEKVVTDWLKNHTDISKGERVFVPGNYSFYLNWYTNIWQVRGALFQASTNKWPEHIYYQLANGFDPEIARDWFVATNTKYAVITTPASQELYKEIKNPNRFENYPQVYNQNGDIIYQIPLKRPSLAKPVNPKELVNLNPPIKGDDKEALVKYANWVENSSQNQLDFKVIDNQHYKIEGNVSDGEAILVQMTGDSGWGAYDNIAKSGLSKAKDPLGYLLLYPKKGGKVSIDLKHGTSWYEWLGYLITVLTVGSIIWFKALNKNLPNLRSDVPLKS